MLQLDPSGVFRLAALQSPAGRRLLARSGRSPDDLSSIVLVDRQGAHIRSEAILRIAQRLQVPLPLLAAAGFPVPLPLRDAFYDTVANHRQVPAQPSGTALPSEPCTCAVGVRCTHTARAARQRAVLRLRAGTSSLAARTRAA